MQTSHFADLVRGLATGLAENLSKSDVQDLESLGGLFSRYPDQPLGDFVDFVDRALDNDDHSPSAVLARIRSFQQDGNGSLDSILTDLDGLTGKDLRKIARGLKIVSTGTKAELRDRLTHLLDPNLPDSPPAADGNPSRPRGALKNALTIYQSICDELDSIAEQEIERRLQQIYQYDDAVLVGLLEELDLRTTGTRAELVFRLSTHLNRRYREQTRSRRKSGGSKSNS